MIIRQATPADARQICEITNQVIRKTTITFTSEEKVESGLVDDILERGAAFQVLVLDGQVAGFATYGPFRAGPGYAYTKEHTIQLAPKARGAGYGVALMQTLEDVARSQNVHSLIAGISGSNATAIQFHHKCGFEQVGSVREAGRKFEQWHDLILMQKML